MERPAYKRVLLKLSGEALLGKGSFGIDIDTLRFVAAEIAEIKKLGIDLGIVVGGGNIFRGVEASTRGIERASADYIGMLATIMNSLALQNALEKEGVETRVQTSIEMRSVAEPFIKRRAVRHLEKGRVVVFAGGTGNPFFTTDTAATLRAMEIQADVILKGTKVDGVYDKDPVLFPEAQIFETISYAEVLARDLKVMDGTAISMCRENNMPVIVFNLEKKGNIKSIICGKKIGTYVGVGNG